MLFQRPLPRLCIRTLRSAGTSCLQKGASSQHTLWHGKTFPFGERVCESHQRVSSLVAQCSATPATVAATPPCSATPFQTQISVRHLPGQGGGGGATPKFLGGVARHRCYSCKTLSCDTCSATGGTRNRVQQRVSSFP